MKKNNSYQNQSDNTQIDTQALRVLLARISDAALLIDIKTTPEQASKLSTLMMNLTKAIRETESYNAQLKTSNVNLVPSGTLDERLKGYAPSAAELKRLKAELKERLQILGPRLFEDDV